MRFAHRAVRRLGLPRPMTVALVLAVLVPAILAVFATTGHAAPPPARAAGYPQAAGSVVSWGGQVIVSNFTKIAAAGEHNLALKSDGRIVAWGWNGDGQCNVPEPNANFVAIAAGGTYPMYECDHAEGHSLGLKADGTIAAWGDNAGGECNVPEPNSDFVAIAAGETHSLGVKSDGRIVAWGSGPGAEAPPEPNTGFVAAAGGEVHSLGLKSDGTVVAWGCSSWWDVGQCDVPEPNADFVAVAAGGHQGCDAMGNGHPCDHSLGLKAGGTIMAWGDNDYGECNVPSPNADFVALAAGSYHSLGIKGPPSAVPIPQAVAEVRDHDLRLRWSPNPVSGPVNVTFDLPERGRVSLELFDVAGRRVSQLFDAELNEGTHEVPLDLRRSLGEDHHLPAGVYHLVLRFNGRMESKRVVIVS